MKQKDVFPSKWLSADDLGTARPIVTINKVGWAEFNDGTRRRAVWFEGKEKGLSLNATNWKMIAHLTGCDDDDQWIGKRIRLCVAAVPFKGEIVNAVRVDSTPLNQTKTTPKPAPPPPPEPDFDGNTDDFTASEADTSEVAF